jgi:hypothetical protein
MVAEIPTRNLQTHGLPLPPPMKENGLFFAGRFGACRAWKEAIYVALWKLLFP